MCFCWILNIVYFFYLDQKKLMIPIKNLNTDLVFWSSVSKIIQRRIFDPYNFIIPVVFWSWQQVIFWNIIKVTVRLLSIMSIYFPYMLCFPLFEPNFAQRKLLYFNFQPYLHFLLYALFFSKQSSSDIYQFTYLPFCLL